MSSRDLSQDRFAQSVRTVLIGLICNIALAITKTVTGILGNSYALIADGVESIMDVISSLIVLAGIKISSRPADENHPYGHGKAESLAAMFVSLALILVGCRIAFESIQGIIHPRAAPASFTLMVLLGVIFIKEFLFRFVIKVAKDVKSVAVQTDAWHHRSDAITSLAAFIGISIALLGGPGYESADSWAALLASAVIGYNGINLLKISTADLMDQAQSPQVEENVRIIASRIQGVMAIEKCRVRKSGFHLFVDIHVEVDPQMSVVKGHDIAHQVKDSLISSSLNVADVLVHIEPAGYKD